MQRRLLLKNISTCRTIVLSLGQVASFEDDHGQSVGGGLVAQREQQLAST